jgi:hypothetical protein
MNTQFNAEDVMLTSCRDIQNMDWFDEFRAIGKVPGSTEILDTAQDITSLNYYEYTDLDYVRKRRQVVSVGGSFGSINHAGGSTEYYSGLALVLGTGHLRVGNMLQRLHLSSPTMTRSSAAAGTHHTGGLKYDGHRVTNWGVNAPGTMEQSKEKCDDRTGWVDSAAATGSLDTAVSWDGTGSFKVAKDWNGAALCQTYNEAMGGLDLTDGGDDFAYMYLFLGSGMIQKLNTQAAASGGAIEVTYGTAGWVNVNRHAFTVGELTPGWNLLALDIQNPDSVGGAGATETNVTHLSLEANALDASQLWDAEDLRWDHLFTYTEGQPATASGAAGNVTGTVSHRVTFVTEFGVESNLGPASTPLVVASQKVLMTSIPTSPDPQVIARNIYRDLDGDAIYRYVDTLWDNTTVAMTDDVAESALGGATAPIAGDSLIDNSPPPFLASLEKHGSRFWGVDKRNQNIIWISDVNDPEKWKLVDQIALEESVIKLKSHPAGLMAYSTDKTFILTGDGVTTVIRADEVGPELGTNGERSVTQAKALHFTAREAELFEVVNPADPWLFNGPVLDQFRAMTSTDLADAFMIHDRSRFRVLFFRSSNDTVWSYQYATAGGQSIGTDGSIDPLDLRNGNWSKIVLPASVDPLCAELMEDDGDDPQLWIGGADDSVYFLQDASTTDYATASGSAAVNAYVEWHAVPMGYGPRGRGRPRYLELQVNNPTGGSVALTVDLTLLEGIEGNQLATKQYTITVPTGDQTIVKTLGGLTRDVAFCRVKISNNVSGDRYILRRARLYYIPRTGFSGEK